MKLYVLIDENYDPSYRAVQGAHAVAEYLLRNPGSSWRNHTLVFLKTHQLDMWMDRLRELGKDFNEFTEPDVGNKITAIATLDDG
jgi:hypothetical protein